MEPRGCPRRRAAQFNIPTPYLFAAQLAGLPHGTRQDLRNEIRIRPFLESGSLRSGPIPSAPHDRVRSFGAAWSCRTHQIISMVERCAGRVTARCWKYIERTLHTPTSERRKIRRTNCRWVRITTLILRGAQVFCASHPQRAYLILDKSLKDNTPSLL